MTSLKTFVLQRLALIPVTIFFMVTMIFFILRVVPGRNPIRAINPQLPLDKVEEISALLGLNRPILDQYFNFLERILNLDFGVSFKSGTVILDELVPRFAATIELTLVAVLIGMPLGIYVGTYSGRWRETRRDHLLRIYSIAVFAVPIFLFGIYIQYIFGIILQVDGVGWISPNLRTSGGVSGVINAVTGIYLIDSLFFSGIVGGEVIFFLIGILLLVSGMLGWFYLKRNEIKELISNQLTSFIVTLIALSIIGVILFEILESVQIFELIIVILVFFIGVLAWLMAYKNQSKLHSFSEPRNILLAFVFFISIVYFLLYQGIFHPISEIIFRYTEFSIDNLISEFISFIPGLLFFPFQVLIFLIGILIWPLTLKAFSQNSRKFMKKTWLLGLIISLLPLILYLWESWYDPRFEVSAADVPVTGFYLFTDVIVHLLLPGFALALLISGVVSRVVRTNMIVAMNEAYIDASRARGIAEKKIVYNYAQKNATIPAIPLFGTQFALLLAGALLTETTFSYRGLGFYLFQAIQSQDFPQIEAAIVFLTFSVAIVSFFTDLLYASLDPRVRL
ncbi:MAG: Dipeptide transport system permease protein DppB [Candidatus Heimdallarchaeota archaeon LC_3]|nr:MAG: Dipeptide transport system permease protein DppB [Candidatus Heimdallarchaeota archaeon LC_3]